MKFAIEEQRLSHRSGESVIIQILIKICEVN